MHVLLNLSRVKLLSILSIYTITFTPSTSIILTTKILLSVSLVCLLKTTYISLKVLGCTYFVFLQPHEYYNKCDVLHLLGRKFWCQPIITSNINHKDVQYLNIGCNNYMYGKKEWFSQLDELVKEEVNFGNKSKLIVFTIASIQYVLHTLGHSLWENHSNDQASHPSNQEIVHYNLR